MEFKKKRIRKGPAPSARPKKIKVIKEKRPKTNRPNPLARFVKGHYVWASIIVVVLVAMGKMAWNIATLAEEFSIKEVVLSAFSEKIKTDEDNHTNILLLGTGTETHDGANLTDTIIVASIDHDTNWVSMLSIPRDLYIEIDELYGGNRINSIFELYAEQEIYTNDTDEDLAYEMSYELLTNTVSEVLDIPIHYYARINFNGFVDVVDAIGGVDVEVETDIYDPYYPAEDGTINYQVFSIQSGLQHLDGATALKYVRSRKTTSDFDRAARQQQTIQAIKDKALSLGVLANPNRLKNIYDAVDKNFDTNMAWDEMAYVAKISDKFTSDKMASWVLNDNPLTTGGFLYTPEREYYGGNFVLLPYVEDYSDIQKFADLVLMHPEVHGTSLTYQVTNGTTSNGIATETLYYLGRFGFDIVRYGNAANRDLVVSRLIPVSALMSGQPAENATTQTQLSYLMEEFIPVGFATPEVPAEYLPAEWTTEADVILELGADYVDWMNLNLQHFY
jgi:polyisoprenyl-teichoic acid--peptidoglycan teichoic acid transferase